MIIIVTNLAWEPVSQQQYISPRNMVLRNSPELSGTPSFWLLLNWSYLRMCDLGKGLVELLQPRDILFIYFQEPVEKYIVQFSHSVVSDSVTPWTAARQPSLSITNSWSLLKLKSIESVRPSNHLILCHPLLLPPSIFPCIRVLSNESVLHIRWPKYWCFSFSISPFNKHSGLISFRIDRLDLLAVPGTLKSLLQHHSSKASIRWHSAFFIVQLSHPYMTTRKDKVRYMILLNPYITQSGKCYYFLYFTNSLQKLKVT